MKYKYTIFLDMDGVCTDFVGKVLKLFNKNRQKAEKEFVINEKANLNDVLNVSTSKLWKEIEKEENFWENLEETSIYKPLISYLNGNKNLEWYYCTSPSLNPRCVKGKLKWIQKRHGRNFRNYVFTSNKHLLAKYNSILIDDTDKNIYSFKKSLGKTILVPRPWNSKRSEIGTKDNLANRIINGINFYTRERKWDL